MHKPDTMNLQRTKNTTCKNSHTQFHTRNTTKPILHHCHQGHSQTTATASNETDTIAKQTIAHTQW